MEDIQIAKLMLQEFPTSIAIVNTVRGRDCIYCGTKEADWRKAENYVHKVRTEYNHGYHSLKIPPKIQSYRYDCFGKRSLGNRKRKKQSLLPKIKPEMIEPIPDPTVNLQLYHPLVKQIGGTDAVSRGEKLLARDIRKNSRKRKKKGMVGRE